MLLFKSDLHCKISLPDSDAFEQLQPVKHGIDVILRGYKPIQMEPHRNYCSLKIHIN